MKETPNEADTNAHMEHAPDTCKAVESNSNALVEKDLKQKHQYRHLCSSNYAGTHTHNLHLMK